MIDAGTYGAPNWVDLSTPDVEAAKNFYTGLFGWEMEAMTTLMGEYFVGKVGGREVCGMMQQDPLRKGMPAVWTTYVYVEDVDEIVTKVDDARGKVVQPPFDIPGGARVGIIADPTGAMLGIVSGGPRPEGAYFSQEAGKLCWVELLTRDPAAAEGYYSAVFGWRTVTETGEGTSYTMFKLDDDHVAGMMMMPGEVPAEAPSHWALYFTVSDCGAIEKKALELGGEVLRSTRSIDIGKFAVLADPQGANFHLMEFAV